jgi:HEAT repeat protein
MKLLFRWIGDFGATICGEKLTMMKRLISVVVLALILSGCAKKPPMQSGGRTAAYWAEALHEDDVEQRLKAAKKLGPLVLIDPAALPALLGALKDDEPEVRAAAARSLGTYTRPKAAEVLPALREVQERDKDPEVRESAAAAIANLGK